MEVLPSSQRVLAPEPKLIGGCEMLVITESAITMQPSLIKEALRTHFGHHWRYSLVAVPDMERFLEDGHILPLAKEMAVGRMVSHNAKVLLLTHTVSQDLAERALKICADLTGRRRWKWKAVAWPHLPLSQTPNLLAICSSDWRLHGNEQLLTTARQLGGRRARPALYASTLFSELVAFGGPHSQTLINQIAMQMRQGLKSALLLDLADEEHKDGALDRFLPPATMATRAAAEIIRKALPRLKLRTAYAFVNDERLTGLVESSSR